MSRVYKYIRDKYKSKKDLNEINNDIQVED